MHFFVNSRKCVNTAWEIIFSTFIRSKINLLGIYFTSKYFNEVEKKKLKNLEKYSWNIVQEVGISIV
jgi:hypothetical protein